MLRESAEALCVLCKHGGYCSSRLNERMHLLVSLAQKQIQFFKCKLRILYKPLRIKCWITQIYCTLYI